MKSIVVPQLSIILLILLFFSSVNKMEVESIGSVTYSAQKQKDSASIHAINEEASNSSAKMQKNFSLGKARRGNLY